MASTFNFELVSPERVLMSGAATEAVMPGTEGDFGVLAGHAPMVSALRPGIVEVTMDGTRRRVYVKGGFVEVAPDQVTLLAERAIGGDDLDAHRIAEEIRTAEAELAAAGDDTTRMLINSGIDQLKRLHAKG